MTNTKVEDVYVEKQWIDEEDSHAPIEVELVRSLDTGEESIIETVQLSEEVNWKASWKNLVSFDKDGNPYHYSVREVAIPDGYTLTIKGSGTKDNPYILTNEFETIVTSTTTESTTTQATTEGTTTVGSETTTQTTTTETATTVSEPTQTTTEETSTT